MSIHQRIQLIRTQSFGPRGRARFARALGISPSTYNYYERDRVPPPALLVQMCQVTGTDLEWLMTGQAADREDGSAPILKRLKELLPVRPNLAPALASFLDALEGAHGTEQEHLQNVVEADQAAAEVVPVLGRTAAGVPQFWSNGELAEQLTNLRPDQWTAAQRCELADDSSPQSLPQATVLIQTHAPVEWAGISISEFLRTPNIRQHRPNTFALRIDGDSMQPAFQHGDIVLLCPTELARNGQPAVIQLRNQIGLTCKLYRRQGNRVHLIPINETVRPTSHPKQDVVWALRVLGRVRV